MKIKICGMKYCDNIGEIITLQPDYLGFIFYEESSRFFEGTIPPMPNDIKKVGVFVNASLEEISEKIEKHHLDMIQLHGNETPEYCQQLKSNLKNNNLPENTDPAADIEILKVFCIKDDFNFNQLQPYESACDYFLFDTKGELPGGNGYTFNWEVLKNYHSNKPYFLSGGIGMNEVKNLLQFLERPESEYCKAIDINSKFEIDPGLKDMNLIREFQTAFNQNQTNR